MVDAGDTTRTYDIVATRAGRRVDTTIRRGVVEIAEVTRGGTVVRTARFMANRVLALIEYPAPRPVLPEERPADQKTAEKSAEKSGQKARSADAA